MLALLDAVGPARLMARMRSAGGAGVLPPGRAPGLAIGLGGIGLTLNDLVEPIMEARGIDSAALVQQ